MTGCQRLPVSHNKADGLINLALGYRDLATDQPDEHARWLKRSAALLQEAAAMAEESGGQRLASYAYGHLGHLYEEERRLDEALQLTRRAVFAAQSAGAPESLYRWQWQSGRLLTRLGSLDGALSAYQEAAATLQPIRAEVAFGSQASLDPAHQSIRSLYFELADLLLQRAALMTEDSEADSYLKAARDAIEAYKAAELRDYFRDDCVDQIQARLTKLDAVSPATAIIYPIMFSDRTELLVSFPDGLRRHSVPVTASALTAEIRSFRRMLEKRTTREYLPHAQQLYDWLLRPLLADLRRLKVNTLVFVPDGPLRTIPMSALHDGSQFLIAQYAVAMTPGLDLTDPRPINRTRAQLLSSGLTKAVQGFPPLPHVAEEMAYLQLALQRRATPRQQLCHATLGRRIERRPLQHSPHCHARPVCHGRESIILADVRRSADHDAVRAAGRAASLSPGSLGTPHVERLPDRYRRRPCRARACRHCGESRSEECPRNPLVH